MKIKRKIQVFADFAMTVMLPLLMVYNMIGDTLHEWIGAAMFVMFIIHHVINFRFAASIAKGKYTANRILITAVDFLLLADMLALIISAVILSRHVFAFLHLNVRVSFARTAHLLGSYWAFILMSVHIGIHFHTVISMVQKKISKPDRILRTRTNRLDTAREIWYNIEMIVENKRKAYESDLTDSQWEIIEPLMWKSGNKSKWEKRELINAVLYIVDSGCKWRQLPHDFPPHTTVSNFYYKAVREGLWEKILKVMVSKTLKEAGKSSEPSYALIDSQSVKTVYYSDKRGYYGGKKQKDESDI